MYAFTYHRPSSVSDATALLAANADAKFVAGGQTLLPAMKLRLANPSDVVDLVALRAELSGIRREGDRVVIGAMARHGEIATSEVLGGVIPALAGMAAIVGDPAVRARGTMGGSLANNDPAADYPAAALALGATIVTDRREIGADDYFQGLFETALEEGEMITAICLADPEACRLREVPQSRLSLRHGGSLGGGARRRRGPGHGHRARVPRASSARLSLEAALKADFSEAAIANVHGLSGGAELPTCTLTPPTARISSASWRAAP